MFPFHSTAELQKRIDEITTEPIYIMGRGEVERVTQTYEGMNTLEQNNFWSWLINYTNTIGWKRRHLYALFREFIIPSNHHKLIDDFAEFDSGVCGECNSNDVIRLSTDPTDIIDLYDYIHTWKWLTEKNG